MFDETLLAACNAAPVTAERDDAGIRNLFRSLAAEGVSARRGWAKRLAPTIRLRREAAGSLIAAAPEGSRAALDRLAEDCAIGLLTLVRADLPAWRGMTPPVAILAEIRPCGLGPRRYLAAHWDDVESLDAARGVAAFLAEGMRELGFRLRL